MRLPAIAVYCLTCFVSHSLVEAAPAELVNQSKLVKPMQLRILASAGRHDQAIEAAVAQQARESAADKPWSDDVFESNGSKRTVARWVTFVPNNRDGLAENPLFVSRDFPNENGKPTKSQILVVVTDDDVTSDDVESAAAEVNDFGDPTVTFQLTNAGARRFEKLTSRHLPQGGKYFHLGIILHDQMRSAPRIQAVICKNGQVSGKFTEAETKELADTLNSKRVAPRKE